MADIAALLAQGSRFDPIGAASRGLQLAGQAQQLKANRLNQLLAQERAGQQTQQFEQRQKLGELQISAAEQQQIQSLDDRSRQEAQRKINQVMPAVSQTQNEEQLMGVLRAGGFEPDPEIFESNLPFEQKKALTIGKSESFSRALTGRTPAAVKSFAPVTLVNPQTQQKMMAFPTFDPKTGLGELKPGSFPAGFELSTETPEEKRAGELAITRGKEAEKVAGKKTAERAQKSIDEGLTAADGFANLARARDLLNAIPTGGIDAVSLRAKQLFGVEGADEAELSNRMGKAVLSQLRTTFGAAFTAKEGESLSRIEAGFGKSTAGNKRLIQQTMKIVERAAKRGIRAAERSGDKESAKEIRDALSFRLDDNQGGTETTPQTQQEFDALPSGAIYIDPDDGKRYRKQ